MIRLIERLFVWCGGALFVAALALTAWLYALPFGVARPPTGWASVAFDALLLAVFALHHSLFARETLKRAVASVVPERLTRPLYVWIASCLLIIVCLLWQPIGGTIYAIDGASSWALGAVQLTGIWLIVRATGAIDPLELAGIRNTKASDEDLQWHGVYALVRHPIYLGWVLIVFGTARMTGDRLVFAALTTTYLIVAMPWEERSLERQFGAAYQRYKEHVRWRLIPYVY
jgi:protein-S-isoprenylcysteine O-methyltransferase Ste14